MSSSAPLLNLVSALELRLGHGFVIEGEVAKGGMSRIYSARRPDTNQKVAVKVMIDRLGGSVSPERADLEERFLVEMQILQKIEHPRIPAVLDAGEVNGSLWFTMPFIEGDSLRTRLKTKEPISVRDALLYARDVADELAHIHARGIIHRDVKPDNLMLSPDGVWLIDFGIARAAGIGGDRPDSQSYIMGTAEYISPERMSSKRLEDARSDLFSLGCVLFEMMTGRAPFPGGLRDTMKQQVPKLPLDFNALTPRFTDDVIAILRRSLALFPSDRYASASAMAAALEGAANRLAVSES